jgi:hypothetical protein
MLDDAENRPGWAVAAKAALAPGTRSTGEIDFTHDTFPDPRFVGSFRDLADEFVAGSP